MINQTPIQKAAMAIEKILRDLQNDHGITIDQINISDVDITCASDKNKTHLMQIYLCEQENIARKW